MKSGRFAPGLAVVLALALGGSAIAEHIDAKSPPVAGTKRTYHIFTAMHSGRHLTVAGASTKNGAEIGQWNLFTNVSSMNEQREWANPQATWRSFELIAQHVMPAFQDQAQSTLDAKARATDTRPAHAEQQNQAVAHMTERYQRELAARET